MMELCRPRNGRARRQSGLSRSTGPCALELAWQSHRRRRGICGGVHTESLRRGVDRGALHGRAVEADEAGSRPRLRARLVDALNVTVDQLQDLLTAERAGVAGPVDLPPASRCWLQGHCWGLSEAVESAFAPKEACAGRGARRSVHRSSELKGDPESQRALPDLARSRTPAATDPAAHAVSSTVVRIWCSTTAIAMAHPASANRTQARISPLDFACSRGSCWVPFVGRGDDAEQRFLAGKNAQSVRHHVILMKYQMPRRAWYGSVGRLA